MGFASLYPSYALRDAAKSSRGIKMEIEGKPAKRFTVKWGTEVRHFDAVAEVLKATKRLDRVYEIYDRRKLIERQDLWEDQTAVKLPKPNIKKLTKLDREALQKFLKPTADARTPTPATINSLVSRKLLARAGRDENNVPIYVTTIKGRQRLNEPEQA